MNEFAKTFFFVSGFNAIIFILSFAAPTLFLFFFGVLVIELIVGFIMILITNTRQKGGGILVAAGICFLIGYSICSSMTFGHM